MKIWSKYLLIVGNVSILKKIAHIKWSYRLLNEWLIVIAAINSIIVNMIIVIG